MLSVHPVVIRYSSFAHISSDAKADAKYDFGTTLRIATLICISIELHKFQPT